MVQGEYPGSRAAVRGVPRGIAQRGAAAMSGHKNFNSLRELIDADPVRRARVDELARAYAVVLKLSELREARGLTQRQLADRLHVSQAHVSQLERKADLNLSTLSSY